MKRFCSIFLALMMTIGFSGWSKTQGVTVIKEEISVPYDSLGEVEVNSKLPFFRGRTIGSQFLNWVVTSDLDGNTSQEAYLQDYLNKKLIKAAKKNHNVDALIHVKYWPDLKAKKFPEGRVYARGEMIRYKRFAS